MVPSLPTDWKAPAPLRRGWRWLTWPLWNRDHRRLRAPLRAFLPLVVTFLALAVLQTSARSRFDHPRVEIVELVGFALILAVGTVASARLLDRRTVSEYGFSFSRQWWRSFAAGGVIATLVNAGAFAVARAAGWVTVVGVAETPGVLPFLPALGVTFAYITVGAAWEEFVFRAAMLRNLAAGADGFLPRRVAIGIGLLGSTVVFAALHAGKVTHVSQYGYYLLAGLLLGGAYVLTGDLSLAIGFHAYYNFTMSAVFGLGVSQQTPELLVLEVTGPTRWVGEEGLVHVLFAAVGGVLLLLYVYWRDGGFYLNT